MIDTHCHLNFKAYTKDYRQVYKRALEKEVYIMVTVGAKIASSEKAVLLADELDEVYASVGIHPHHIDELANLGAEKTRAELERLITKSKVVALGETGLDYFRYKGNTPITDDIKSMQEELLLIHIQLAKKYSLPIIFHCREAMNRMLVILVQAFKQLGNVPTGVFHCFSGTKTQLKKVLKLGFFVGFDGNITYAENEQLRERVKETPLNHLLIETDAPFLTPEPYRGTRNEPAHVTIVAKAIADIKKLSLPEVIAQTTRNAKIFFSFS